MTSSWGPQQHEALVQFLRNVTSSDMNVQRDNILQLQRFAFSGGAAIFLLEVLCSGNESYEASIRHSAGLILKQIVQINPTIIDCLNADIVGPPLLRALADTIPSVNVAASLVVASIVRGEGLLQRWPQLLETLKNESSLTFLRCQQATDMEGFFTVSRTVQGLATCTRIVCEECNEELRELIEADSSACECLGELFSYMLQAVAFMLRSGGDVASAMQLVLSAATSCFVEKVFFLSDNPDESFDDSTPEASLDVSTAPDHTLHYAKQLHEQVCALVAELCTAPFNQHVLVATTEYLSEALRWDTESSASTINATVLFLPHVLYRIRSHESEEESIVIRCLTLLGDIAETHATVLSGIAREVAETLFYNAVHLTDIFPNTSEEETTSAPDDEATVRPVVLNRRNVEAGDAEDHSDENKSDINSCGATDRSDGQESDAECATTKKQVFTHILDVMSCTCPGDLLAHLIPLITSALTREANSVESLKEQQAALFILAEVVDELFDDLHDDFLGHVSANCWGALGPNSTAPHHLRYQAVRCVARMSTGWAASARRPAHLQGLISPPPVLHLLIGVTASEVSKQVQLEAINSITKVTLYSLDDCRIDGETRAVASALSTVIRGLVSALPSMQYAARTATYRCLSEVLSVASGNEQRQQEPLIDDITTMHTITALGKQGQQLASLLHHGENKKKSGTNAVELISLMNAMVEVVSAASKGTLEDVVSPLTEFALVVLNCSADTEGNSSSIMEVYGSDIATLVFDMLDGCCSALMNEEELLCMIDSSLRTAVLLKNVMVGYGTGAANNVVSVCAQILEERQRRQQFGEVELARSCVAFLSTAMHFHRDPHMVATICRLCLTEVACEMPAVKAISNVFLCLGLIFYNLLFDHNADPVPILHVVVPSQSLNNLTETLRSYLTSSTAQDRGYVKMNAFICAVALAALHQVGRLHLDVAEPLLFAVIHASPSFIPRVKNHIGEAYRLLLMLSLLLAADQSNWAPVVPTIVKAIDSFTSTAPTVLSAEVRRRYLPLVGANGQ
ncbi:hypothetical protein, conserved [Trypanosoma brucei brucei TREU927]|uniref:Uncharacterized protein n=1 Tax=Trypanosoma brucei brucei (strain 927/4 GUTat10.1) TaxID=185431 RepID=Q583F6_TRYB2|nr:hypothetical protein, conserved [Trypanosoma brucei brucei TREU927]AAX80499.1 hypothetical protein, conserved [Trypanosoma brucei]AAZ11061.1 hypothetical protein, conserved [Trypanosoma brucei brucei TREU927]